MIGADPSPPAGPPTPPRRRIAPVVVVGAGAAGTAAVLALRSHGHEGSLTLVDPEPDAPYDRPNLSKDYLEGTAPEEWLPLRGPDDWKALGVRRIVDRVAELDIGDRRVRLQGHGEDLEWDALVLATGARPRRLGVPGSSLPHVLVLRSLEDCRKLRDRAARAARVVVVGTGFLGLEAAASLRRRDLAVAVVGPEREPLEHVFGREVGAEVRAVHEREGVVFRLERTVTRIDPGRVALSDGTSLPADLVLVSVGVQPDVRLAEAAGLALGEGGVAVDRHLATSAPGVWAVGDIASFPHPEGGRHIRIEHWAVAEAQGRIASRNVLGIATPFDQIPFFWTKHFDTTIAWSGFPDPWDRILREGSLVGGDAAYRFVGDGRDVGLATVGRDRESLQWEIERSAVIERASRR